MSASTARTCASTISAGTICTAVTPIVLCAVIAVIAVIPCTPQRANAFKSAWMPAPPPESDPAIESTLGVCVCEVTVTPTLTPSSHSKRALPRQARSPPGMRLEPSPQLLKRDRADEPADPTVAVR